MKYLKTQWKSRLAVVLVTSIIIAAGMIPLEATDWASQINQQGYSHGEGDGASNVPSVLIYILPFVKEIILIGVPMSIALLLMKVFGRKKRSSTS